MSTLIGMPATSVVLAAPVDPRRWPFAAAVLSGDESVASYADEAARSCALGLDAFGSYDLRITAGTVQRRLTPASVHVPTLIGGASPFASEWGQDPAKCWPNVASRCD
jgi:hypothetical protein